MLSKTNFKKINQLAFPSIIAGISEPLISLADIAIIGNVKHHPIESLAATGIVGSFISAIIWTLAQTKTSISSIVSQNLGANRIHAVKTLVPQVIAINFLLGILVYIFTLIFAETIFTLYNTKGLILSYSLSYYKIRAIGFPITLITFAIFGVFRGLQNTYWAMKASLIGTLVNVLLGIVLVYGIEGILAPLHLKGAAIASIVAQLVMLAVALYFFYRKTGFKLYLRKKINPNLKKHISLSMHLFLRTIALNLAIFLANAYATDYGKFYIAAHSILMNIWLFFTFFIDGFASAGNAISGKLIGAKAYKKLWWLSIDLSKYAVSISIILIFILFLGYNFVGTIFNQDTRVLLLFKKVFWIVLLMQPINAITFVFDGIFKGIGDAAFLRNTSFLATFIGFIPILILTDYYEMKLTGIWMAFYVWMLVRGSTLIFKFRRKFS